MSIIVANGQQSMMDLAIQLYGGPEGLPSLARLNGQPFSWVPPVGTSVIHDADGTHASASWMLRNGHTVATDLPGGIGAWIVSLTFIIE